ncbi:MAG: DUF1707 and DUF2154 domain-containing protein [Gemmatimonadales bacterium]|nr:MAG: DUF1707 and DUF2154 domain-containing protein [Gemmatimonadales bacterium]
MSPHEERKVPGSPLEREQVVERLCDHYAADHLAMEEFERRITLVHRAATQDELRALLADLPSLQAGQGSASGASGTASSSRTGLEPAGSTPAPARARAGQVRDNQTELAIWSGRTRTGPWIPARTIRAVALMGGIELDFREALFPEGEIRLHVVAIMGGVDITVPPGVRVETGGIALLGGFDEALDPDQGGFEDDAPVLRITGAAFLGGVDITSRHPGESPREARRRRKRLGQERQKAREELEDRAAARRKLPGSGDR